MAPEPPTAPAPAPAPAPGLAPAPDTASPLLELAGVCFDYGARAVLRDCDLQVRPGDRIALIGPNGAGKSTLLHLLVGLQRPRAGRVIAFGQDCREEADFVAVRPRVGLLFQHSDDQLFCPTVLDDVAFGPLNLGLPPAQARASAEATLAALGLAGFGGRITHRLSGGERRLVALATVLAMAPEVLLLDEPTNGLDEATEARLIAHLQGLPQAMLIVSHDQRFLGQLANRAVVLRAGRLRVAALHRHPHTHQHVHLHLHLPDETEPHADALPVHRDHHDGEA